jgi:Ni,Fe-hydrogenase I large subunit
MSNQIVLSPVTRIEGHLSVHVETEQLGSGEKVRVKEARCEGEMFRGLERILEGRDPLDAQQITQRICGVCPVSHGIASIRAQEMVYGVMPNKNGRILQNLIFAANYLHSHILHFYQLAGLDFVDVTAVLKYSGKNRVLLGLKSWIENSIASKEVFPAAPFLPRFEVEYVKDPDVNVSLLAHYVEALDIRKCCDEMGAIFGAKLPHATALIPGGCTQIPTLERILAYSSRLKRVLAFIRDVYIPDMLQVAQEFPLLFGVGRGCGNFLCFGVFLKNNGGEKYIKPGALIDGRWEPLNEEAIQEQVRYSWYASSSGRHPSRGETVPAADKNDAYSWIKAPRYRGKVMEVGPLARVMVNYYDPNESEFGRETKDFLSAQKIPAEKMVSVLGRHVSRGLESFWLARQAIKWLDELTIDELSANDFEIPKSGSGYGLTEAPRGALGHWLTIEDYRIKRYQCIVPTTWNCSPRDDEGQPGAVEQAIQGTTIDNPLQPIEIGRIVRSFDPCIACAVH